jgi:hypothetical protein
LQILLDALVLGDGSKLDRTNKDSNGFMYYSTSKQLADDVYEIAYRCGYVPTCQVTYDKREAHYLPVYTLCWSSNTNLGTYPQLYKTFRNSNTKEQTNMLNIEKYNGNVWCLTVPTGLFITRRNGRITIQGNSAQSDKDFKIFTHNEVTVERVGAQGAIVDTMADIQQLIKEIYIGLLVPQVLMESGDITYANGGLALDVLRQRYMQFRNYITAWLRKKIFAPISMINDFYEIVNGEKILIVPDIDWNHMAMFDMADYIGSLNTLTGDPKKVSLQTLYRSLGLDYEEEKRKIKQEEIDTAILNKEKEILSKMPLTQLRALDANSEITEPTEELLPGEVATPGEESAPPPPPPPPPPT